MKVLLVLFFALLIGCNKHLYKQYPEGRWVVSYYDTLKCDTYNKNGNYNLGLGRLNSPISQSVKKQVSIGWSDDSLFIK